MVGTSHQVDADVSGGYIYAMKYTIREHSHNHPNRSYGKPSEKDRKFAESLKGIPTYILWL